MGSHSVSLGELIHQVGERNKELLSTEPLGVSIDKEFMPSVANTIGTDLSKYMLLRRNRFACNPMHVGRDRALPIARYKKDAPGIVSPAYMTFEADENKVDLDYLELFFKLAVFDKECWFYTDSSVRGGLSWDALCSIKLNLPSFSEQHKIAMITKVIRDRIAQLAEQNDYLLELTKVLFAHWFKDFAPFQDEETYATEIGDIPTSVKLVPLVELTKVITKGTTPTTLGFEYKKSGINFIKGESIGDDHSFDYGKFAHIDDEANAALKRSVIEDRDLLFTIAGTLGRFAMAEKGMIPANTNQAVGIIRADERLLTPEVLLSYFIGGWQEDYYARRVQQAVQANLSLTTLKSLPVPVLEGDMRSEYEKQIVPVIHAIEANNAENRRLSELRDALLPKLMSGEIDASKVDLTQLNNHLVMKVL